jgi:hypothetical protein
MDACYLQSDPDMEYLYDLRFATCMARVKYLTIPEPLPAANDIGAIAAYWKQYYNTLAGGTTYQNDINEFIQDYQRYVVEYEP